MCQVNGKKFDIHDEERPEKKNNWGRCLSCSSLNNKQTLFKELLSDKIFYHEN